VQGQKGSEYKYELGSVGIIRGNLFWVEPGCVCDCVSERLFLVGE
jgi:hypothetical protein